MESDAASYTWPLNAIVFRNEKAQSRMFFVAEGDIKTYQYDRSLMWGLCAKQLNQNSTLSITEKSNDLSKYLSLVYVTLLVIKQAFRRGREKWRSVYESLILSTYNHGT